ncbi:MAG: glycine cleavage T C-terminal barrel domain-containing protein, partial [Pseudomonadota bacterium]
FVKMDKDDFIGKDALREQQAKGPRKLLVSIIIDGDVAPAHGGDPVFQGAQQIGSITSGGYGHRVQQNIAYAYVEPEQAEIGNDVSVGILGERYQARIVSPILYDSENRLPRS